jgi:YD repeat-containing protein
VADGNVSLNRRRIGQSKLRQIHHWFRCSVRGLEINDNVGVELDTDFPAAGDTGKTRRNRGYDTDGNLTTISRDGVNYSHSYNGDGTVNSMTDPRGNSTSYGSYVRGVPGIENQPSVSISRSVSSAGNIELESVDGQSFSYSYSPT